MSFNKIFTEAEAEHPFEPFFGETWIVEDSGFSISEFATEFLAKSVSENAKRKSEETQAEFAVRRDKHQAEVEKTYLRLLFTYYPDVSTSTIRQIYEIFDKFEHVKVLDTVMKELNSQK